MINLDTKKTALIVGDMQIGFCKPEGTLYCDRNEKIIPNVKELIDKARKANVQIIFVRDTHDEEFKTKNYDEFKRWGKHCIRGTKDTEVVPELEVKENDFVVEKGTYSAFFNTNLNEFLKSKNIDTVICTGVLTNVCVLHTASDAALKDYRVLVPRDCTDGLSEEDKKYALHHINWLFGKVVNSDQIAFII